MNKNKRAINLIIDSDLGRTIEDDLALCYAFSEKCFKIEAITLSPFKFGYINVKNSQVENQLELHRLLRYIGLKDYKLCFEGSQGFCDDSYYESSPAVKKIISLASKKEITVVCLGGLTNLAIAIKIKPNIAKNLKILWIGLRHIFHQEFTDLNSQTDKKAFEIVSKSDADLTIFPSYIGKLFNVSLNKIQKDICVNHLGNYLYRRITGLFNFSQEFCRMYSITPIAYLINHDFCYVKKLPLNLLLKDFQKTSMTKLVNYVYDLKSTEEIWKNFANNLTKLSNNFSPINHFFISDTHLDDSRKYKIKQFGFKTKEEMTETIIKNWNSVVSKKDIVYHLGDFGNYKMIKRLNGKVNLICGNHEIADMEKMGLSFEQFKARLRKMGFYNVFKEGVMLDKKVFGRDIFMNHFPSKTKPDIVNFFGHVHSLKPVKRLGVNVAANYHNCTPICQDDMSKYISFVSDTAYTVEDFSN